MIKFNLQFSNSSLQFFLHLLYSLKHHFLMFFSIKFIIHAFIEVLQLT